MQNRNESATEAARRLGWSVEPGSQRESGSLDWLANENNEKAQRRLPKAS